MTRIGWAFVALLLLAAVAIALTVRVTEPGLHASVASAPVTSPAASPPGPIPGVLAVPVRGVARGGLVDSWADPRGGGTRQHHAIDIMAPAGTPVIAAADGRIEKLFASALGGLTVYERSADGGLVYYYAHLSAYAPGLAEGQAVRVGEVIGAVGATGDADAAAPHLHFEIHRMMPDEHWWQGQEMDPFPMLRGPIG